MADRTLDERVRWLRRDILASLIAVKGHLDQPYPDDARWTPWTRFIEQTLARVDELAGIAQDALHGRKLARLDAENERRLAGPLAETPHSEIADYGDHPDYPEPTS